MSEPTQQEINRVVAGYNRAGAAADYGATIVCEMQQVEGDNYCMVWSTEYNGGFVPDR